MAWNTTDFKNDGRGRIAAAPITAAIPDIDYRTSINVLARHRLLVNEQVRRILRLRIFVALTVNVRRQQR